MPDFDWEEFLELAEELVRRRGDVGAERTAISRAYYAVFHKAGEVFARSGERLTFTADDHWLVWDWFANRGDAVSRTIGERGQRLRRARRLADYDPAPRGDLSDEAQKAAAVARLILTALRRLP